MTNKTASTTLYCTSTLHPAPYLATQTKLALSAFKLNKIRPTFNVFIPFLPPKATWITSNDSWCQITEAGIINWPGPMKIKGVVLQRHVPATVNQDGCWLTGTFTFSVERVFLLLRSWSLCIRTKGLVQHCWNMLLCFLAESSFTLPLSCLWV